MDVREKKYSCDRCGKAFKTNHKRSLLRHKKNIHEGDVNKVILKEEKLQKNSQKKYKVVYTNVKKWHGATTKQKFDEAYSS